MRTSDEHQSTPLKLKFGPGDYLVTWDLPTGDGDETFHAHGSLDLVPDKAPEASAHGNFPHIIHQACNGGADFPQRVKKPFILGRLSNGPSVILLDVDVTYWHHDQAHISAAAAIVTLANVNKDTPLQFRSIELQVGGLDAVDGTSPIESWTMPHSGFYGKWSVEFCNVTQAWNVDAKASLELDHIGAVRSSDSHSFSANFSPILRLELCDSLSFRDVIDSWIDPIRIILSIITGRQEPITYLSMNVPTEDGINLSGEVFGSSITQNPYIGSDKSLRESNPPIKLKQDGISLLDIIVLWQDLVDQRHPLIETYGTILHTRDQHPRSRFLLLIQAIEGAHGFANNEQRQLQEAKFLKKREDIIAAASESLNSKERKFLKKNLKKRPPSNLNDVFTWLGSTIDIDISKFLGETDLVQKKISEDDGMGTIEDAIRIIRNDLAHGNRGYEPHDLHQAAIELERMVRAHALQLLGCPLGAVARLFPKQVEHA